MSQQSSLSRSSVSVPARIKQQLNLAIELQTRKKTRADEDAIEMCAQCHGGGPLILCDVPSCAKGWHKICAGLTRQPSGRWECPSHTCVDCDDPSVMECLGCAMAFCERHKPVRRYRSFKSSTRFILCASCTAEMVFALQMLALCSYLGHFSVFVLLVSTRTVVHERKGTNTADSVY